MKPLFFTGCLAAALALAAPTALAGDIAAGEEKAQVCIACHGEGGNKPIANYPKLGGQLEKYLIFTLNAYKDGSRPNAVMAAQTAGMSAEDIADLAAYFSAQDADLQ